MATSHSDYCIIGGGVSGCLMAVRLTEAGYTVQLFEKSRGLGGRLCHRRSEHGRFLHGLQFLHIRDKRVESILQPWLESPNATELGPFGYWNGTAWQPAHEAKRIRFFPETSTFCQAWTANSTVHMQTRITKLEPNDNGWTLYSEEVAWTCSQLIVSAPYTQLLELLPEPIQTDVSASIQVNETAACSIMLRFNTPINLPNQWDGGFVENNLIHFLSKQDSCEEGRHWTLVLDGDWTENNWKLPSDNVLTQVLPEVERLFGHPLPHIEWSNVHWWKYAFSQSTKCDQQHFAAYNLTIIGDGTQSERGLSGAILSVEGALSEMP